MGGDKSWAVGSAFALLSAVSPLGASPPPPDLRLEWLVGGRAQTEAPAISGRAGESLRVPYQLRNVGGTRAHAAILSAHTTLGPLGKPERVQPGPRAGEEDPRYLDVALAEGVEEVCLLAELQTLNADDPQDPNLRDNRLCRKVEVREGDATRAAKRTMTPRPSEEVPTS